MSDVLTLSLYNKPHIPRKKIRRMMRLLTYHPQKLVTYSKQRDRQLKHIVTPKMVYRASLERMSPISLLAECWGKSCPNNRLKNPDKRHAAEQIAVQQVIKLLEHQENITLQFLGSGSLLQELRILHLIASQVKKGSIEIIISDPLYEPYHAYHRAQEISHIFLDQKLDITKNNSPLEQTALLLHHMRLWQFVRWCEITYSHINWKWHSSTGNQKLEEKKNLAVIAIDTELQEKDQSSNFIQLDPEGILNNKIFMIESGAYLNSP